MDGDFAALTFCVANAPEEHIISLHSSGSEGGSRQSIPVLLGSLPLSPLVRESYDQTGPAKKDPSPMVNLLLVAPSLATFSFGLRLHGIMSHCMALMMPPEVQRSCEDASIFLSDIACSYKINYTATHIGFLEIFNEGPMRPRGCSSIGRSSSFVASQKLFGSEGSAELQCSQDKGMVHRCIAQLRTTAANSLGPIPSR